MKILVVSKTTNLDLHGEKVRRHVDAGIVSSDHLSLLKKAHKDHYNTKIRLLMALEDHDFEYTEVSRGRFWPNLLEYDAIITIGGDGTVLEASHHIEDESIQLIGLRSSSTSVGHLCLGSVESIDSMLNALKNSRLHTESISRLKAEVSYAGTGGSVTTPAILNDMLFANSNPAATSRYKLLVGDKCEIHKSSGVWVATAAGSTAAISAAGGHVADRKQRDYQYKVRELYVPPGGEGFELSGGFVDLKEQELVIENRCDNAILALDGQHGSFDLEFGDSILFKPAAPVSLATAII